MTRVGELIRARSLRKSSYQVLTHATLAWDPAMAATFQLFEVQYDPSVQTLLPSFARWVFANLREASRAYWALGPKHGIDSSDSRSLQNCTSSVRSARESVMPSQHRATCSSISVRSAWICASSWRRESWPGLEPQSLL